MKNITQIKLNEIKENIYCLDILKLQYLKNNIWFDIPLYCYNNFFNFSNYEYFQNLKDYKKDEKYNHNDIKFIYDKNNSYDVISILIKFITHFIIKNKQDIFSKFITILKNNITSTNNSIIYFNNKLFEDIYKLNLNINISFKILNANPKIIEVNDKNDGIYYTLEDKNIIKNSNIITINDINANINSTDSYASYPSIYDKNNITDKDNKQDNNLNYVLVKNNKMVDRYDDIYYNIIVINLINNDVIEENIDEIEYKEIKEENERLKEENKKLYEDLKMLKMILTNPEEFFNIKNSK